MNSPAAQPPRDPREQLLRYLDGSLPSDEVAGLNAALKSQAALRRDLAELLLQQVQLAELGHAAHASASAASTLVPLPTVDGVAPTGAEQPSLAQPTVSWRQHALPLLALAACLAVLLGAGIWFFGPTMGEPGVAEVRGNDVSVERGTEMTPASRGMRLQPTDVLRTGTNATAMITFGPEKTLVELRPGSELKMVSLARGKRLDLRQGNIEATVARQRLFKPMLVRTPQAEARVLGTKFTLAATTNSTRLEVNEGNVKLTRTSDGAGVKVAAGDYAVVANGTELKALPQTGSLLREIWTGIPGDGVRDLLYHPDYPGRPAARDFVKSFETDEVRTNDFGCRLVGYIHPPVTGKYTFWIAAAADATLWLSPNENPNEKVRIATAPGGEPHQWEPPRGLAISMPQSPPITLVAGRRYFIQAVQKTARGSSHLAVAWQPPGGERGIIPGEFLSPFKPNN